MVFDTNGKSEQARARSCVCVCVYAWQRGFNMHICLSAYRSPLNPKTRMNGFVCHRNDIMAMPSLPSPQRAFTVERNIYATHRHSHTCSLLFTITLRWFCLWLINRLPTDTVFLVCMFCAERRRQRQCPFNNENGIVCTVRVWNVCMCVCVGAHMSVETRVKSRAYFCYFVCRFRNLFTMCIFLFCILYLQIIAILMHSPFVILNNGVRIKISLSFRVFREILVRVCGNGWWWFMFWLM